ncbi:hypothetical protein DPMN_124878 [Dreissena polymorpha]|uniref:Uncharacterized protein n=1 Tax=Dreissena polymorpha TaxID=45954 RepID=A0A9D4GWU2_DREPO|nr:hypothetical protein DPMN_124878 [Dreissena polymorpha]
MDSSTCRIATVSGATGPQPCTATKRLQGAPNAAIQRTSSVTGILTRAIRKAYASQKRSSSASTPR